MTVDGGLRVRAAGLTRRYGAGAAAVEVFNSLDFTIEAGERVAIAGPSGCGKSTLLYLLGGLDRPTAGTVWYGDRDLFALSEEELAGARNREVGFVWQMHGLLAEFTAEENVMMPLLVRGVTREEAASRAGGLLEAVGLEQRGRHRAGELSGGEQQRVALARALVGRPRLLLADEPTGNLDPATGETIVNLIAGLQRRSGFTSVMVTHNPAFAERCDRILQLEKGSFASRKAGEDSGSKRDLLA